MKKALVSNMLTKVSQSNTVAKAISRFYAKNEPQILTAGTIGFFGASEVVVYRNSPQIHECIKYYKKMVTEIDPNLIPEEQKNLKNQYLGDAMKELAKLTAPLIIFNALAVGCAIASGKAYNKRIASLTAALTMSQNALSEYEAFKNEVTKQLGEEKVKEIASETVLPECKQIPQNLDKRGNEDYIYEPITGRYFTGTQGDVDLAVERVNHWLDTDGGSRGGIVTLNEFFSFLGLDDTTGGDILGWEDGVELSCYLSPMRMSDRDGGHSALVIDMNPMPKVIDTDYIPGFRY